MGVSSDYDEGSVISMRREEVNHGSRTGNADLAAMFELAVRRYPARPAVCWDEGSLTYAELGVLARKFACGLRRQGVASGAVVALVGERGPEACAALLGILLAGGAYFPIDPGLPASRIEAMVDDVAPDLTVILPGVEIWDSERGRHVRYADVLGAAESVPGPLVTHGNKSGDIAYVMCTSGSTGRPKAVAVTHRGVARLSIDNGFWEITPEDRVLHASTLSFDASTLELWSAFPNGACVVIVERDVLISPPALAEWISARDVSVVILTTGLFHHLARENPVLFSGVRWLLVAGEALRPEIARRVLPYPEHFINGYGPCEGSCLATTYEIEDALAETVDIPIGTPISDTDCHVLDENFEPVPEGRVGDQIQFPH
ncbi:AMP-binding protein, partial [Actinomadura rubrisoli]